MRHVVFTLVTLAALAGPAFAQAPPASTPPAKTSSVGLRGYAVIDADAMAATESFKAVFGSSQMTAFGGGAEVDIWKHLFLRIAASRAERTGTRVFIDNGTVFDLGIPMTVTLLPVEAGAGWRFAPRSRFTPYVGGAFVSLDYQQVSDQAEAGENVNERYTGSAVFGGVDVVIWKGLFIGGEAQYRHIPVPETSASVMQAFGETNLGGVTARLLIGFTTKH